MALSMFLADRGLRFRQGLAIRIDRRVYCIRGGRGEGMRDGLNWW
jgi:hypothetical protein